MYKVTHPRGNIGQWISGIVVGLTGFTSGLGMSWAAIFFPKVRSGEVGRTYTLLEESFIASMTHVGQLVASFPSAFIQNKCGRRNALIIIIQAQMLAWVLILISRSFWTIILARFFMGSFAGFAGTAVSPYAGEIAVKSIRGRLCAMLTMFFTCGLLFQTSVGSYLSYNAVAVTSFCLTFTHFIALLNVPESPYSLLRIGKVEQAERNLKWLRGGADIRDDFDYIKYHVNEQMARKTSFKDIFRWKASRKAFTQAAALMLVQRLCGFFALTSFTSQIFPEDWNSLKSEKYPMVWNCINVTFLLTSFCLLDYVDRKVLLMISTSGCALFGTVLVTWFYLYEKTDVNMSGTIWIPYIALSLHAASYTSGLVFIALVYYGEIFPINIKAKATSLITFGSSIAVIIMVQIFLPMKRYFGMFSNFMIYTTSAYVGCYVCTIITETRNKSLEYIQSKLEGVPRDVYESRKAAMHKT